MCSLEEIETLLTLHRHYSHKVDSFVLKPSDRWLLEIVMELFFIFLLSLELLCYFTFDFLFGLQSITRNL